LIDTVVDLKLNTTVEANPVVWFIVSNETVPADGHLIVVDVVLRRVKDVSDESSKTLKDGAGHLFEMSSLIGVFEGICK
jgi:hypothetical protein